MLRKEVPGSDVLAYKGEAEINAPTAKVMSVLKDTERRHEWAYRIEEARVVQELSPTERIEYVHASAPWPVKDRDFVYHLQISYLEGPHKRIHVNIRSTDKGDVKQEDGRIRAEIYSGSFDLVPVAGGTRTRISAEFHADPKGKVPKWLVNLVQKSAPRKSISNLMKQVKKENIAPDPMTVAWLER